MIRYIKTLIRPFWEGIIHLIYPHICMACEEESAIPDFPFCVECEATIGYTTHFEQKNDSFLDHFYGRIPVEFGGALLILSKSNHVKSMLHRLKYRNQRQIGTALGSILGHKLELCTFFVKPDLIIPIPVHSKKLTKRGYNQAKVIADAVGKAIGKPVYDKILLKKENISTLTQKSRVDRLQLLSESLLIKNGELLTDKHILIVDDVLTTGATLVAAANKLLAHKVKSISVTTIAVTK